MVFSVKHRTSYFYIMKRCLISYILIDLFSKTHKVIRSYRKSNPSKPDSIKERDLTSALYYNVWKWLDQKNHFKMYTINLITEDILHFMTGSRVNILWTVWVRVYVTFWSILRFFIFFYFSHYLSTQSVFLKEIVFLLVVQKVFVN